MQWSLFLLVLMGQCFFYSCRLYEYHLIEEAKTWIEAQGYCRERYSDLATVTDMADTQTLKKMMRKTNVTEAWIGLQSHKGKDNRKWHWSLPGVESDETQFEDHWNRGQPNDAGGKSIESCAQILKDSHKWHDHNCGRSFAFICYNDADQNDPFKVVHKLMNWTQAQKHCREHHTDLISGLDQLEKFSKASGSQLDRLWIGLFRDTWRWSNGSNSSFRNWNTDKVILIKEKLTWDEAVDYCREHHHDLVSITNPYAQRWVQARARKAATNHVWLGLRYTCSMDLWFWVSDDLVCYSNWKDTDYKKDNKCYYAAAMERGGVQEWVKMAETNKFNFICSRK
ncbi:macrophage mannose receptor 1-like [Halichoeres trimaculatus]|uniref:macrophage mannose receptor 1-like n=1 Tax=Halichoeres trimaculatus TaxID=147232 RepID=UPI003D9F0146